MRKNDITQDEQQCNFANKLDSGEMENFIDSIKKADKGDVFLNCIHGKSKYQAVWPFESLAASNKQLKRVAEKVFKSGLYHAPNEGDLCDLRGKILIVSP